ncbi:hypothetical protein BD310DRAFT_350415 [Dichomitus squalens]|uniref:Uncharacterized protein n=1 Tax=Dichomitus squalens TaxID=114155 RepID=A0A4Q9PZW2_9APHY|nr:hypothetical protein BD310DRAFT_350415 [Dichomitus squalens]
MSGTGEPAIPECRAVGSALGAWAATLCSTFTSSTASQETARGLRPARRLISVTEALLASCLSTPTDFRGLPAPRLRPPRLCCGMPSTSCEIATRRCRESAPDGARSLSQYVLGGYHLQNFGPLRMPRFAVSQWYWRNLKFHPGHLRLLVLSDSSAAIFVRYMDARSA